jgi:hypothetical protein
MAVSQALSSCLALTLLRSHRSCFFTTRRPLLAQYCPDTEFSQASTLLRYHSLSLSHVLQAIGVTGRIVKSIPGHLEALTLRGIAYRPHHLSTVWVVNSAFALLCCAISFMSCRLLV